MTTEMSLTVKDSPNPYLFPSNSEGHIDTDTINNRFRDLAEKGKIKIPKSKRLRFHAYHEIKDSSIL